MIQQKTYCHFHLLIMSILKKVAVCVCKRTYLSKLPLIMSALHNRTVSELVSVGSPMVPLCFFEELLIGLWPYAEPYMRVDNARREASPHAPPLMGSF